MIRTDGLLLASLVCCWVLSIIPMPGGSSLARPEWPLLVYLYWTLAMPERYGVLLAAVIGLFQDGLTGGVTGMNMLAYAVAASVFAGGARRIRMFNVWQQAILVGLLLLLVEFLQYWITRFSHPVRIGPWLLLPPLSAALLWPWLMVFLRGMRRKAGVTNPFG